MDRLQSQRSASWNVAPSAAGVQVRHAAAERGARVRRGHQGAALGDLLGDPRAVPGRLLDADRECGGRRRGGPGARGQGAVQDGRTETGARRSSTVGRTRSTTGPTTPWAPRGTTCGTATFFSGGVTRPELHVVLGLTILGLGVLRLVWRRVGGATAVGARAERRRAVPRGLSWRRGCSLLLFLDPGQRFPARGGGRRLADPSRRRTHRVLRGGRAAHRARAQAHGHPAGSTPGTDALASSPSSKNSRARKRNIPATRLTGRSGRGCCRRGRCRCRSGGRRRSGPR